MRHLLLVVNFLFLSFFAYSQPASVFVPNLLSEYLTDDGKRYSFFCLDGNILYSVGDFGIRKFDISKPDNLKLLKSKAFNIDYRKRSCYVDDNYLFVSERAFKSDNPIQGLVRLFDKNSLSPVSTINLDRAATDFAVDGDYLYCCSLNGFSIYDISDPVNPCLICTYKTDSECQGVSVFESNSSKYAFVCNFLGGITIFDITDPRSPFIVSRLSHNDDFGLPFSAGGIVTFFDVQIDFPYAYTTMAVKKNYVETEDDHRGVVVWNISDVNNVVVESFSEIKPKHRSSSIVYDVQPYYLTKYKNWIIANNSENGVAVFDILNKTIPEYHGSFADDSGEVMPVIASDNGYLFVGRKNRLSVLEITDDCTHLPNYLYCDNVNLIPNGFGVFDLAIGCKNDCLLKGVQFDMILPEGVDLVLDGDI